MAYKKATIKELRLVQSYLYQNNLHIGSLWAALSLEFEKKTGLCGSVGTLEIALSKANLKLYEEVIESEEFKKYLSWLNPAKPKKRRRK